jgi:hypothetical protein
MTSIFHVCFVIHFDSSTVGHELTSG